MKSAQILVFDTGSGGLAFADFLSQRYPEWNVQSLIDTEHSPYGPKSNTEIIQLVQDILAPHIGRQDAIVLACNTATAVAIDSLRQAYPEQIFIGFEPMIKTAAKLTKTGTVAILATAATKKSARYQALKSRFPELDIVEPNCNDWATKIDQNDFSAEYVKNCLGGELENVDTIVLGCIHYVAAKDLIEQAVKSQNIQIIEPFASVADYIAQILANKSHE